MAVLFHISVARVSKPVGRSMRVAGSSFIADRKTKSVPVRTPGAASGRVTREKIRDFVWPRVAAISVRLVGTFARDVLTAPTDLARKRIE
jgi:hypothetical protein